MGSQSYRSLLSSLKTENRKLKTVFDGPRTTDSDRCCAAGIWQCGPLLSRDITKSRNRS